MKTKRVFMFCYISKIQAYMYVSTCCITLRFKWWRTLFSFNFFDCDVGYIHFATTWHSVLSTVSYSARHPPRHPALGTTRPAPRDRRTVPDPAPPGTRADTACQSFLVWVRWLGGPGWPGMTRVCQRATRDYAGCWKLPDNTSLKSRSLIGIVRLIVVDR